MAFPTLGTQQETNRKILEDLQLKRQLLQKGVNQADITLGTGLTTLASPISQMPTTTQLQLLGQPEFPQSSGAITVPRSVFNPTSATTLGYFISQDSHYGRWQLLNMARMRMKKLEEFLSGVDGFEKPKIKLEQYPTPPHIASCVLYNIQAQFSDLENKLVGDLGCGCGMLSIGSFLLGSQLTVGFELDTDAIDIFNNNVTEMELPAIDCVQVNVLELPSTRWENVFDTVVSNPPFGTKHNAGMDMKFVETGIHLATGAVYSLHKTSTRDYVLKKSRDWKVKGEVVAELKYNIEASYKFHKSKSVDIEVDFWRFDVTEKDL